MGGAIKFILSLLVLAACILYYMSGDDPAEETAKAPPPTQSKAADIPPKDPEPVKVPFFKGLPDPAAYPADSPEHTLATYFKARARQDWEAMAKLCDSQWQRNTERIFGSCEEYLSIFLGEHLLVGARIIDVTTKGEITKPNCLATITVDLAVEITAKGHERPVAMRTNYYMRQRTPMEGWRTTCSRKF